MSYDYPDGPDYNPEPLDDDPWDTRPYATDDDCGCNFELLDWNGIPVKRWYHEPECPNSPAEATDDDLSDEDS